MRCFLLVLAGFTLTSTSYMAWVYHVMDFATPELTDGLAMVGGYAFQALGIGIMTITGRRYPEAFGRVSFVAIVAMHFACAVPATFGSSLVGTLAFGYLMNILCGAIAAHYLYALSGSVGERHRGIVFGGAYACSIIISWLLSFVHDGMVLGFPVALIACLVLSIVAVAVLFLNPPGPGDEGFEGEDASWPATDAATDRKHVARSKAATDQAHSAHVAGRLEASGQVRVSDPTPAPKPSIAPTVRSLIAFAAIAVLLMSLVKNAGFGFPSADFSQGLNPEFTRMFYAAGLLIAGAVIDRSLKYGAVCCMAALVIPFVVMALANEPIPGMTLWALDYFFFGFFSVFRVVLFAVLAARENMPYLAGCGLMFGRAGDALGTAVYLTLGGSTVALVSVAAVLFAATLFVIYRLAQILFPSERAAEAQKRDERAVFEEFSARYELSAREREVLRLLLEEQSNAEIAAELFVSESTVKFHVRNLLKKTDCKNRLELRAKYISKD